MDFFRSIYQFFMNQGYLMAAGIGGMRLAVNLFEIFVLGLILVIFYRKFIKGTTSESLVRGIFVLMVLWLFAELLMRVNLQIFGIFIKGVVIVVAVGLIVIFQPELRRFLGYLGQNGFLSKILFEKKSYTKKSTKVDVVKELVEAIKYLSKSKTGGLIVLQREPVSLTQSDIGVTINADLSQELLLTIFHPNTPLHDGAVVLYNDTILSAGVLLPLTDDPKLSWRYGTRHRAAIGITETSDCACIVVSEETGEVSIAVDGTLKKYEDLGKLRADLERILGHKKDEEKKSYVFKFEKVLPDETTRSK